MISLSVAVSLVTLATISATESKLAFCWAEAAIWASLKAALASAEIFSWKAFVSEISALFFACSLSRQKITEFSSWGCIIQWELRVFPTPIPVCFSWGVQTTEISSGRMWR